MPIEHEDERATLEAKRERRGVSDSHSPRSPRDLDWKARKETLKRTAQQFSADNLTDWAASLTYYGVLAIFPAIIALVSIIGLFGDSLSQPLLDNLNKVAPGPARDILTSSIEGLTNSRGSAGIVFVIGLVLALNAASGYIGAFTRASNAIYKVTEGRPVWKLKPAQIGISLVLVLLLVITGAAVALSGPAAQSAGKLIGAGDTAVAIWDIAKIPVILAVVSFMFAFLYWAAPNVKQPGFKFVTPGGLVALVIWIVASLLFTFYVANFSSYNKTYGTLGGVVVFLIWLWLSNIAVLFGAEFNAELQRSRERAAGEPAPLDKPFLEPRDASKLEKKEDKPSAAGRRDFIPLRRRARKALDSVRHRS